MTSPIRASFLKAKAMYTGFVAGAPAVDDSTIEVSSETLRLKAGGITASKMSSSGDFLFAGDKVTVGQSFLIPIANVRGSTGLVTTATPADNVFAELISSNVHALVSNTADGGTKTAIGTVQFQLPQRYKAGGLVTVRLTTKLKSVTGTGVANNGSDIDLSVYEQSKSAGTVGSDLCSTSAATYAALDTVYQKDFTIDPSGLVPGDLLNLLITTRAIENDAGNGTLQSYLYNIEVLADVYGSVS